MSPPEIFAARAYLDPGLKGRTISDARHRVSLTDILQRSCLIGRSSELSGRSVLLATSGQLMSALAMIIGMGPMALGLGDGGEQNAPLGRAVIGGLLLATLGTLTFVPAFFSLMHRNDPTEVRLPVSDGNPHE